MKKKCTKCCDIKSLDMFGIDKRNKDGHTGQCRECRQIVIADWKTRNRDKVNSYRNNKIKEYCTYIALFKQGYYIGSGQLIRRRQRHLNGNSRIAKEYGRALSFEVVYKGDPVMCIQVESILINNLGLNNLLNKWK